ncbi:RimK family alpha-L-glutamate ligase [Methyloligella sp. 2.7D]|uniref:RimK family alpha-L-glutamate ligase n=1 Tax=unclassified Methyloligella TaxID=2625955 RepID=UPI00157C942C|nr:RimK family alpha-L-glutamate ligase [Methyloligella sp. GL2]QKP77778.1 RimK family alpha-L-glutamate ligase [Methyloligella sp. GL2]
MTHTGAPLQPIAAEDTGTPAPQAAADNAVLVFGDGKDWHGRQLAKAFKARGITPLNVPLISCGFDTAQPHGLHIPGLGGKLPRAAFVRFVPGGSFEQVTVYLGVLHALRDLGVMVWNDARTIEACVDKSTTSFRLQRAGLATPRSFTTSNRQAAEEFVAALTAEGAKLVQKPLFGAQGNGLHLIEHAGDLVDDEEMSGIYYLQEFVAPAFDDLYQDWRLFICRGQVVASMLRHGVSWITNIKQGARAKAAIPSQELAEMGLKAAACVGADYCGVDVIQGKDGAFQVLEVNSMPAWNGLQRVTKFGITEHVVDRFLDAAFGSAVPQSQEGV